jgi:hypothetical protein
MLQEFKSLAIVTTKTPASVTRLGTEHFAVASLGRQFVVYCTEKLHVKFMSPVFSGEITALASADELTFVAIGRKIEVFNRFIRLSSFDTPHTSTAIHTLYVFGTCLISVCTDGRVCVFSTENLTSRVTQTVEIPLVGVAEVEKVTRVTAIPTYTNKVLFGLSTGELVLFNVQKMKVVHKFACLVGGAGGVTCLTAARVLDVVAVGTQGRTRRRTR